MLNTWQGRTSECWSSDSTILQALNPDPTVPTLTPHWPNRQVLVSIQSLILVREPYYNEPGLEIERGTAQGDRNSKLYSEGARVLTLQSLLHVCRSPPTGIEAIVEEHVALRGKAIWRQCKAQHEGIRLIDCSGVVKAPAAKGDDTGALFTAASAGCRSSIGRLLPKLQAALGTPAGADGAARG